MSPSQLELRLFGGASIVSAGELFSGAATQPRRIAVLAVLAEASPAPVSRDRLIGLIWPEQDDAGARRLLTQSIYEIRRELGAVVVPVGSRDLVLDAAAIDVDLLEFRRAVREGRTERLIELYRGEFLNGFHIRDAGEFERWVASVRDSAARDLRSALDAAIARETQSGNYREAARWVERALDLTPHDASMVIHAMELFERAGDPGAATRTAATYERRMREDLDLDPDPSVGARASQIGATASVIRPLSSAAPAVAEVTPVAPMISSSSQPPRRGSRGRIAMTVAALGVTGLAAILGLRAFAGPPSSMAVTIDPFTARGDSGAAGIAHALTPLLVANLDDVAGIDVDSATDGRAASRRIKGLVLLAGNTVRIEASLSPDAAAGESRVSVSGPRDSLVSLIEQLSIDLMPALSPQFVPSWRSEVVRGLHSVAAARGYLDGEAAFARASYDTAYDALRAATLADSSNAFLWYRRAVAAEEMHHLDDADRSAAIADARRGSLRWRESQLVHAYAVWRTGDTRAADSLYRAILATRPSDPEAWFQFGEVLYHGGPLIGRPLDAARDAWRRAVALDSNSFSAVMHAIRLETRSGDAAALKALLHRMDELHAREPFPSETRAIAAAAGDVRAFSSSDRERLRDMPDASLQFVSAIVASFVERPDLAAEAAARLIEPSRPDAVRASGYSALAHIAMTRGATATASRLLDSLASHNAVSAAWARGYFATLPFVAADSARADDAARALATVPARSDASPLYLELSVDASAAPFIQRYTAALLDIRRKRTVQPRISCSDAAKGAESDLCADLQRGLDAEWLIQHDQPAAALAALESMSLRAPYQLAGRSLYYARTRERFLRAQLLERAGRSAEAYDWYASAPYEARLDYVYLAASHLGRARIRERDGNRTEAIAHYRKALELLSNADGPMIPLRAEAADALKRLL